MFGGNHMKDTNRDLDIDHKRKGVSCDAIKREGID
jgi:hypothetical protein